MAESRSTHTLLKLLLFLSFAALSVTRAAADAAPSAAAQRPARRSLPVSYNAYSKDFTALCDAVREDGRAILVHKLALENAQIDIRCSACRPFFKILSSACKPPALARISRVEAEEDEQEGVEDDEAEDRDAGEEEARENEARAERASPSVPERLPSIETIDLASRLFTRLSEDERFGIPTSYAVEKLIAALRGPSLSTAGEREYSSTLAAYIEAAFSEVIRMRDAVPGSAETAPDESEETVDVDALFE